MRSKTLRGPSSRRLTMLFLVVLLPPAVALVWLGLELLDRDRALLAQREFERREAAADAVTRHLTQALYEAERWLTDDGMPEGVTRITFSPSGMHLYPKARGLWASRVPPMREPATREFVEAERSEYMGLGDRGLSRYKALAASADPAVRAGAVLRLARVHRQAGRIAEALDAYLALAAFDTYAVAGMPADLVARREICHLLEAAGRQRELQAQALALERDLTEGRWTLDRPGWELTTADLRRWTGRAPGSGEAQALAAAVDWLADRWHSGRSLSESGHHALAVGTSEVYGALA